MCISNSIYIEEEKVTGGGIQEGVEISSGSEKKTEIVWMALRGLPSVTQCPLG